MKEERLIAIVEYNRAAVGLAQLHEGGMNQVKGLWPYCFWLPFMPPVSSVDEAREALALLDAMGLGEEEYFWAHDMSQTALLGFMRCGCLPMAFQNDGVTLLTPKLHNRRCVLSWSDLHISKSTRKKAARYSLSINACFDDVVAGVHQQHGENWLYPPLAAVFGSLHERQPDEQQRILSIELWKDGVLVAGELGYTVGAVYTSLTGFYDHAVHGAGTVQMAAMAAYLSQHGFQLWDLGMEIEYKTQMGATTMDRATFLSSLDQLAQHHTVLPNRSQEDAMPAKPLLASLVSNRSSKHQ